MYLYFLFGRFLVALIHTRAASRTNRDGPRLRRKRMPHPYADEAVRVDLLSILTPSRGVCHSIDFPFQNPTLVRSKGTQMSCSLRDQGIPVSTQCRTESSCRIVRKSFCRVSSKNASSGLAASFLTRYSNSLRT